MSDVSLATAIAEAVGRDEVRHRVAQIYHRLQQEIDARRPVCEASGRCCRFEEYGHRLYVTTIELAAFAAGLRQGGSLEETQPARGLPILGENSGCVYQVDGLCSVHAIRPFGCRIFFCDPSAEQWQQSQYERFHGMLKCAHEELGVPYFYVEWRAGLAAMTQALESRVQPAQH